MTKGKIFLVLFTTVCLTFGVSAQENEEKKFIQFVFSNMEKPGQAKKIEEFIRTQEGVYMVRANFNSRKFFLIYYSDSDISLAKIDKWFEPYGITYKCAREGIHGVDKVIDQKIDCE